MTDNLLLIRQGPKLSWMSGVFDLCEHCCGSGREPEPVIPSTLLSSSAILAPRECWTCYGRQGTWLFYPVSMLHRFEKDTASDPACWEPESDDIQSTLNS